MFNHKHSIPLVVVELEEETIHLLVRAEADGLENHWWVIDTGASKSVIDREVATFFVGEESAGSMATGFGAGDGRDFDRAYWSFSFRRDGI